MFNVPPQLTYNQLQTKAFFSVFKPWPIEPISNGGQFYPGQVIRIFLNALTDGVMDPYRSHIQITVQCDQKTLPVGLLQVDNSAQSFLQQIVITSRNREVQRIIQYGALAAYLTDIGISELYAQGKQSQGLGYSNIDNYAHMYVQQPSSNVGAYNAWYDQKQMYIVGMSPGTVFPSIPSKNPTKFAYGWEAIPTNYISAAHRAHLSHLNLAWNTWLPEVWYWNPNNASMNGTYASLQTYGYVTNLRTQYLSSFYSNNYVDSTSSISKYEIRLDNSVQQNQFPAKFQNGTQYLTYQPRSIHWYSGYDVGVTADYEVPNTTSIMGFTNIYSPQFAKGVREPFISPTVPQCQIQNGRLLPIKIPVRKRTFKIPLISAVIGLLIPQSQFVLLPLRALNDLYIELTIDQSAMFTSGYNDIAQYDNIGMGLMQQRAFKVTRLIYNLHTYQFFTPEMDQYLVVNLTSGIAINTQFWQMGNQYQVQNSQSLTNAWPVACNQEALNQILVLFYPLDYVNFSFCRKHFRISNNITKLQLRINMEYYPSQPLSGNAGCPVALDSSGDNSVFLQQIFYSNNYMFSNHSPMPRINCYNFAINERCYDILNNHTLYDPQMISNLSYKWNNSSINVDTAMGYANLHENRWVGKAAYVYSFQPYAHSANFLTGIDCRQAKQFDILFTSSPDNWFPRPQTMYIFTRSSVIMEYGRDGIVNMNK